MLQPNERHGSRGGSRMIHWQERHIPPLACLALLRCRLRSVGHKLQLISFVTCLILQRTTKLSARRRKRPVGCKSRRQIIRTVRVARRGGGSLHRTG